MKIVLSILTIGLFLILSSCCTMKDCNGFDEISEISLVNFAANELDSIAVESFAGNTNFVSRIDSFFISHVERSDNDSSFVIYIPERIKINLDYKITFISTSQTYFLTNIETIERMCNTCFPYHPSEDFFKELKSYNINGKKQYNRSIIITK